MRIQRLNMDNSWYFAINGLGLLVDPWLEGEEVDFFRWFNTQWHRTPPLRVEDVPAHDLVLVTQKYPDHFHRQTLLRLNPRRVVGPASIERELRRLLPSAEIISLGKDRPRVEFGGVSIQWYPSTRPFGPVYEAFAISDQQETVFIAPHGYIPGKGWKAPETPVKVLVSTFNDFRLPFFLGGTIAPGVEGLSRLVEKLAPARIVATHDEDKHAIGLVMKLAKVRRISAADLGIYPQFKGRVLELDDYRSVDV
jgi:hypothetical protein